MNALLGLPVGSSIGRSTVEPRISFHETTGRFLVAYVDLTSNLRLAAFKSSGLLVDGVTVDTGIDTVFPAEVVCDTHAATAISTCFVYVAPTSGSASIKDGQFLRLTIGFSGTGLPIVTETALSSATAALIVDGGTLGAGVEAGQPALSQSFWLNTRPFHEVDSSNEVRFIWDDIGLYDSAVSGFKNSYTSLATFVPDRYRKLRPNVSSMDWNESIRRFVVVSATE